VRKKLYKKYKDSLLGVISDIRFPRKGEIDNEAGFRFARRVKREIPDLPFLLQSTDIKNKEIAYKDGLDFLYKRSENLLQDLQRFILSNFGFGDFVFKNEEGDVIGRAKNLQEFEDLIQIVPRESIIYHASRNHISIWLRARKTWTWPSMKFRITKFFAVPFIPWGMVCLMIFLILSWWTWIPLIYQKPG
jgi:hypothetical protein